MIENKKTSIILVLRVLQQYSDEEHFLTQKEIIDLIYKDYGIELERKSVANSLILLGDELDYDICKNPKGGWALFSRTFENSEVAFLIDAIFSSKSISGKHAIELANKALGVLSKYHQKDFSYIVKSSEITRTNNKDLFFIMSIIHEAMTKSKRVSFCYLEYDRNGNMVPRKNGYRYIVSPYYLINNFGKYYLLCNYREKYRPLHTFRIDFLSDIAIEENWPIKPLEKLEGVNNPFSIKDYLNEHVYLFGGEVITSTIEITNPNAITAMHDWFGKTISIKKQNESLIAEVKCNEDSLFYWCMQYSESIKVLTPTTLVERIAREALRLVKLYKK
jgi:predicted DNA-binding transcriptional regulator YafY